MAKPRCACQLEARRLSRQSRGRSAALGAEQAVDLSGGVLAGADGTCKAHVRAGKQAGVQKVRAGTCGAGLAQCGQAHNRDWWRSLVEANQLISLTIVVAQPLVGVLGTSPVHTAIGSVQGLAPRWPGARGGKAVICRREGWRRRRVGEVTGGRSLAGVAAGQCKHSARLAQAAVAVALHALGRAVLQHPARRMQGGRSGLTCAANPLLLRPVDVDEVDALRSGHGPRGLSGERVACLKRHASKLTSWPTCRVPLAPCLRAK